MCIWRKTGSESLVLPGDVTVTFKEHINGNPNYFYYEQEEDGSSLVITLSPETKWVMYIVQGGRK